MGNVPPQRLECSTNAGTAQQDLVNSAAEERQSVFYRSRVTNCSSADFSKKPAGTSDDFAWARERAGMISVKVSAFSENTAETCGENGRGKEKKGELSGANWGLLTRNWGNFPRILPANRQKAQHLLHFVHDKSYKCRTDLVFLQVKSTRTDGETGEGLAGLP